MKRLARLLLAAAALVGCTTKTASPRVSVPAPEVASAPPKAPPPVPAPSEPPHTGIVAYVKWVAPNARTAAVRGVAATLLADDLERAGITTRIETSADKCAPGATEDIVVTGFEGPPKLSICDKGPIRIGRGQRDRETKHEIWAYESVSGGAEGEVFSVDDGGSNVMPSTDRFVPVDPDLMPSGDGAWSAYGPLVTTPDKHVAIKLRAHAWVTVIIDDPSSMVTAAAAVKGTYARITGKLSLRETKFEQATLGMHVTRVDATLDPISYAALQKRADIASKQAAALLRKRGQETKARDALVPARDAFVDVFGAPVDRGRFFDATIKACESSSEDYAFAYARAAVAGTTVPEVLANDRDLRAELAGRAEVSLENLALDGDDEPAKRRAARVLWKVLTEAHVEPRHLEEIRLIDETFPHTEWDIDLPI